MRPHLLPDERPVVRGLYYPPAARCTCMAVNTRSTAWCESFQDLLGPRGGTGRIGVGSTHQRVPVQVVENLGDAAFGEQLGVGADVVEAARQRQPAAPLRHDHRVAP